MLWKPSNLVRRRTELGRLALVLLLTVGTLLLAQAGLDWRADQPLTWRVADWLPVLLRYGALLLAASLLISWWRPQADQALLPIVGLLGGLSLMLLYRLPTPYWDEAAQQFAYTTRNMWYVARQARFLGLGSVLIVLITTLRLDLLRLLRNYRYLAIALGLGLLAVTALWGESAAPGGPRVTLDIGVFSFQPSELIKLLFVVYLASYLNAVHVNLSRMTHRFGVPLPVVFHYMPPLLLVLGAAVIALVMMSDLGVTLILLGLFPALVFVALKPRVVRALLVLTAIGGVLIFLLLGYIETALPAAWRDLLTSAQFETLPLIDKIGYRIAQSSARIETRIEIWRDPWAACSAPDTCSSYQTLEGLYAVAAGGILGAGPGLGLPDYIPFVHTDLIFAALVEEWGLLGGLAILALYLLLLRQGAQIARRQSEPFRMLLAIGIVMTFALQLLVILGGTLNLLPLTGITVPFLSFGGTSLLINSVMVGLLLRLSAESGALLPTVETRRNIDVLQRLNGALFGALALLLAYWTLWMGPQLHPGFPTVNRYSDNLVAYQRQAAWLMRVERGRILAADGTVLADNAPDGRVYALPSLAQTLGQTDGVGMGRGGIEQALNPTLLGQGRYDPQTLIARYGDGRWRGNDVRLTIDPTWQAVADHALGGYNGAVVVLDAHSGAILALVSHPLVDPTQDAATLAARSDAPLLNRALNGRYPPGSTFKTVVAGGALAAGIALPETQYDFLRDFWYTDEQGRLCHRQSVGGGVVASCNSTLQQMTLTDGLAWSDNVLFAQLAVALGDARLWETAAAFGFGGDLGLEIPVTQSALAAGRDRLQDQALLAQTGFGQAEIVATPLQMALVAAAVANDGELPQPALVAQILTPGGRALHTTRPRAWGRALPRPAADALRTMMIAAVTDGWASTAGVDGVVVGGKTGTAEWAGTAVGLPPHSWYIGFAEYADGRTVALAVLAEGAGDGSAVAAPIAAALVDSMR